MIGVYVIKCTDNSCVYVGSTNNLTRRRYEHFHKLRKGMHPNRHLQNAFNKYGEISFSFISKKYSCASQVALRGCEDRILELYRANAEVFNLTPVQRGRSWGWKPSAEHILRLSELKRGRPRSEETKIRCSIGKSNIFKSVKGISLDDGAEITFDSTRDAEKSGFGRKEIRACCNGIHNKHKGYTWSWT